MADPARWLNKNIPGWRRLSREEKRAIRDFPVLWSIFELTVIKKLGPDGLYRNGNRRTLGPEMIKTSVRDLDSIIEIDSLRPQQDHFARRYFRDRQPTHAFHALNIDRPENRDLVEESLFLPDNRENKVLEGLLLITNRLRNNYLHGTKAENDFADQFENFAHANNLLMLAIPLWR